VAPAIRRHRKPRFMRCSGEERSTIAADVHAGKQAFAPCGPGRQPPSSAQRASILSFATKYLRA
jgi:hypothetical protein